MDSNQVDRFVALSGALAVDSLAAGLHYFIHEEENRIAIGGQSGVAILSAKQAEALAQELGDILEIYGIREHENG